jgi:hypothetical protein
MEELGRKHVRAPLYPSEIKSRPRVRSQWQPELWHNQIEGNGKT